jgi:cell wall-associated NlpC family hydrolase
MRGRLLAGLLALAPSALAGQGITFQAGRLFDDGGWSAYGLSWSQRLLGPLGADVGGRYLRGPGSSDRLFGAGIDASLFRGGRKGLYLIGGVGGGIGTGSAERWWGSWSAGVGYELVPFPVFSLGIETRFREMTPRHRSGAEVAVRVATAFGGTSRSGPPPYSRDDAAAPASDTSSFLPPSPAGAGTRAAAAGPVRLATAASRSAVGSSSELARDVITIAEAELGRRYEYGGTGGPGDGFDCSGLIQYAYGRIGITLPRRSVDQARAGREIGRDESELLPGDVLTFSEKGRGVTHVGLYMGDGRFIHSASRGVQVSRLGNDDPNGRWWYRRWVGARRVIERD